MRESHPDATDRLQLLVDNEADRRAIRQMLSDRYEVIVGEELQAVDCYLIDDRSLPAYKTAIEQRKAELDPTFQPVLLLRRANGGSNTTPLGADTDEDDLPPIDEVVPPRSIRQRSPVGWRTCLPDAGSPLSSPSSTPTFRPGLNGCLRRQTTRSSFLMRSHC
jgi:hypothetical protein